MTGFVACHTIVQSSAQFLRSLDVNDCTLPIDGAAASTDADFGTSDPISGFIFGLRIGHLCVNSQNTRPGYCNQT